MPNLDDLAPGQIWTYSSPVSLVSRAVIGRLDEFGNGTRVVSIAVIGVPIPAASLPTQTIEHMPFAPEGILPSLLELEEQGPVPEGFDEGYETWKRAWDEGHAGAFTLSISEAVEAIMQIAPSPSNDMEP